MIQFKINNKEKTKKKKKKQQTLDFGFMQTNESHIQKTGDCKTCAGSIFKEPADGKFYSEMGCQESFN